MVEPIRDSLERLVYRVEQLFDRLESERVKLPLWTVMTTNKALEIAKENQASLDDEKEEVLDRIRRVWYDNPKLRFTQLIVNLEKYKLEDMYYMEDDELVERLGRVYDRQGEG